MSQRSSATELNERPGEMEHCKQSPQVNMQRVDAYSALEALKRVKKAGLAKATMPWADLIVESFLGGALPLGALFDLTVAGTHLVLQLGYRSLCTRGSTGTAKV